MKQRPKPHFSGMTLLFLPIGIQVPFVSFCCLKVGQVQGTGIGEGKQKLEHQLLPSCLHSLNCQQQLTVLYQGKSWLNKRLKG